MSGLITPVNLALPEPPLVTHHAKVFGRSAQSYAAPYLDSDALISVDLQNQPEAARAVLLEMSVADAQAIYALLGYALRDAADMTA